MRFNFLRTILLPVVLSASIILSSALIPAVPVSSNSAAVVESVTAASSQKDVSAETIVLINTDGFSQSALNMTLGQAITWQNETDSVQVIQLAEIDIPDGSTIFLPFVSSEPNAKAAATTYSSDADKTITVQPRQKLSYVISSLQDYQFTLQDQSSTLEVNVTEPDSLVLFHIGDQETALGTSITLNLQAYDPGGSQDISFDVAPLPLPTNAQFDAGTGLFTFRPTSTQTGSYNLTFMTNTGQQTATESVTIDVPEPDPNAPTSLRGQILDANDAEQGIITPLVGATVRLVDGDQSVSTDSDGYFELSNLPDEAQYVEFDGSTATPAGTYGAYRSLQVLIPHVTNVIERPIYIMEVDESGTVQIEPNESIELINPSLGVTVTIPANNVKMDDGSDYSGPISISEVPDEFTPGSLPDNLDPGQVFTIQPMGLTFDEPAPITFPNTEGFTPGSEVNIWSMDHETSEFFVAGKGRVSDDGTVVETIEGGIQESSWHFLAALGAALSEIFDDLVDFLGGTDCDVASSVTLHNGCLGTTIDLPAYAAQDSVQGLSLVYKSDRAYPQLLAPYAATVPLRSAVPNRIGQEVNFAGIGLTNEVFISTADFSESQDETYRSVVYVDTSDLETGVYPYNIRLTNYFANSTVSTDIPRRALVVNSRNSSLGAGWGLSGLQRLYVQANGNILLVNGDGSAMNFTSGKIGFPDFNDISNLLLNGDASALNTEPVIVNGNSVLRLTSAERWQGSSAFYTNPFAVTQSGENLSFKTYFQFQITTPGGLGGGADGLTFVIVSALNNIGGDGGGIGYSGINNSIAVEFDTFRNGRDPNDSHVGIDLNGSLTSEITANIDPNLKDSDIWSAWIEYDGQTERLDVRLSRTDERPLEPILSHSVDLATILGQDRAFLGFTSATGAGYANHDILSWDVEVLGELADEPNRYFPPAGEYSELIQLNDGSFEYRLNDGIYYRFNIKGLQTAMVDRNGNTTSFAYDGQNRLKTITDPVGKPTAFTYEGDHLKTITNPDGRVTTFTHDGNGNLTSVAYPDTTSQSFTYDANHLMTAETDRRGNQTIRNYDRFGRLVSATLPDGTVRQHSYS
ncbi:MAG: putative Ig domain-containing protein, partial [Chloroflexota bacterium]